MSYNPRCRFNIMIGFGFINMFLSGFLRPHTMGQGREAVIAKEGLSMFKVLLFSNSTIQLWFEDQMKLIAPLAEYALV